jgi:hypothetical protein
VNRLDDAIEALDLDHWLSQYANIKPHGDELRIEICPMCFGDKFKLYVNINKKLWLCQRCNFGKNQTDICMLMSAVSGRNINDIKLELAQSVIPTPIAGFDSVLASRFPHQADPPELFINPQQIVLPGTADWSGMVAQKVLAYAYKRGLTPQEVADYGLRAAFKLRKYSGMFLLFPVFFGDLFVAWQGRRIGSGNPKYVSYDNIADWLWPLRRCDIDSIHTCKSVVLTEGVFDALGYLRQGIPALCTFGKKISDRQINLLQYLGVHEVFISWDADAKDAIAKASSRLQTIFAVKIVGLLDPPVASAAKVDPGDALTNSAVGDWLRRCYDQALAPVPNSIDFVLWHIRQ